MMELKKFEAMLHLILERHALRIVLGEVSLKVPVKRPWSSVTTPRRGETGAVFGRLQSAPACQWVTHRDSFQFVCDAAGTKAPVARPLFKDVSQSEIRIR
jgi:hypothetical protein